MHVDSLKIYSVSMEHCGHAKYKMYIIESLSLYRYGKNLTKMWRNGKGINNSAYSGHTHFIKLLPVSVN